MIEKIIAWSASNRLLIGIIFLLLTGGGVWSMLNSPVDAIPDLSEDQVIVFTEWMGRSPQIVEDQVTYPLATALQGLPEVKGVRAQTMYGMSFIFVIFEEGIDLYFARQQVSERIAAAENELPDGVTPTLGPDGTGVGHVYWYTVEGDGYDLATLRSIQDWFVRYRLSAVEGVAEVASIGGFVREYQIDADPERLRAYNLSFTDLVNAIRRANREVGGGLVESSDAEFFVRGRGYFEGREDIGSTLVRTLPGGIGVTIDMVADVQLGSGARRGSLEKDGKGEVVGGIVVMRHGENAQGVIDRVREKIAEIEVGLPEGVRIVPSYDRSPLIKGAIATLRDALLEEALIVLLIVLLFILHVRSAVRILIEIPVSVLMAFLLMQIFDVTSNIMSLGGIALAIGVVVDSSIVLVENAYRNIAKAQREKGELDREDYFQLAVLSAQQVGRAIFFSEAIMVVSFLPVFLLEGQEGKLFHPLAWTKTFVIASSAIVAITLVPVLMTLLMKGRFRREEKNPVMRFFHALYHPLLRWTLRWRKTTIALNLFLLLLTVPLLMTRGTEFMPPLDEGSLLFMPVLLPDASIGEVTRVMTIQDQIIAAYPEVDHVLGKAGRAETATDNAPVAMIETVVLLKPQSEWRAGVTKQTIIADLDAQLRMPGVRNGWTQPIINRINMLATGVRTDLGVKIYGDDLALLEELAIETEKILRGVPGAADVTADRVQGGRTLDIDLDEVAAARYGVDLADVQTLIETAIGGEVLGEVIEGRARYPVRARYQRELRDNVEAIGEILVPVRNGSARTYLPLSAVADISVTSGPAMIPSENGNLKATVFLNVRDRDMGGFVAEAKERLAAELPLPTGVTLEWSGQYENQVRAESRLMLVIPIVFLIIFLMLFFTLKDWVEAGVVMLSVPFALMGGVWLISLLGYNLSVAVWVGFIALYGLAVQTGVVMVVYLHHALDERLVSATQAGRSIKKSEIYEATVEGALGRLRPKLMTVATSMLGLIPILFATGVGSDVMKPLVSPMIGGLLTSALHVLIMTPVLFIIMKERAWRKGTLKESEMAEWAG